MSSPDDLQSRPVLSCRDCSGEALELVVTAPRVGPFPELRTYRCADCGQVVTVESE
jgi:DNA-directed RNA polymerase subunit RPC12/RpoP